MGILGAGRSRRTLIGLSAAAIATLCVAAAPGFGAVKSGTYQGTSTQVDSVGDPKPLMLSVNNKKTKVTIVFFEFTGPTCPPTIQYAGETTRLKPSGKFQWIDESGWGFVKGKFDGNKASGTILFAGPPPTSCNTGPDVTWEARRTGN